MSLRSVVALDAAGLLKASPSLEAVAQRYAVAITGTMANIIATQGPASGVGLQFLPSERELETLPSEVADPIADEAHEVVPGLIHRYADRVLLKVIHACPVYCRFCFRRSMVGPQGAVMSDEDLDRAFAYLEGTPALREVILTGGDPFLLPPHRVRALTQRLSAIGHVQILRWHTRVPLVDPGRVDAALVEALTCGPKAVFVGVHANHADEFSPEGQAALARLARGGIVMVSQSVLLRGVNDDIGSLEALMRAFLANRVKPYYLHQLDPAPGTGHFAVPLERGQALIQELRDRMSGLGVPAYVIDGPVGRKRHVDPFEG